jgi:hypothetical protein
LTADWASVGGVAGRIRITRSLEGGLLTAGSTLDEARAMAGEALALKIKVLTEVGKTIPEPSSLESVMADAGNRASAVIRVPVTRPRQKM